MSSSDDPDTNTRDKCVCWERNRERERDSGVVYVLVMWSRIGPSPQINVYIINPVVMGFQI